MRVFYDIYSPRAYAHFGLLVADAVAIAAAAVFVLGATEGGGAELPYVALWAAAPVFLSRFLGWLRFRRDFPVVSSLAAIFTAVTAGLTAVGWRLVIDRPLGAPPIPAFTVLVLCLAWVVAFLIFAPRVYILFDFLIGALLLLGIVDRKPHVWLWPAVTLGALFFSQTVRHLVYDLFPQARWRRLNLQNARAVALGALFLSATLLAGAALLEPERRAPDPPRTGRALVIFGRPPEGAAAETFSSPSAEEPPPASPPPPAERGFRQTLDLSSITGDAAGEDVLLRVRVSPLPEGRGREAFPYLLKFHTFAHYDAPSGVWSDTVRYSSAACSPSEPLFNAPAPPGEGPEAFVEIEAVAPAAGLGAPYRTRYWVPIGGGAQPTLRVLRNDFGDVFLREPLAPRGRYRVAYLPLDAADSTLDHPGGFVHPDRRYLEFPRPGEIGFDLYGEAEPLRAAPSHREAIRSLRSRFETGPFRYRRDAPWRRGPDALRRFLFETRAGSCSHYATAVVLLLRAAGISARLAAGFTVLEPDPEAEGPGTYVVRALHGHAWVEVYVPGRGWLPLDPTSWVREVEAASAGGPPPGERPGADGDSALERERDSAGGRDERTGAVTDRVPGAERELPAPREEPLASRLRAERDAYRDPTAPRAEVRGIRIELPGGESGPEERLPRGDSARSGRGGVTGSVVRPGGRGRRGDAPKSGEAGGRIRRPPPLPPLWRAALLGLCVAAFGLALGALRSKRKEEEDAGDKKAAGEEEDLQPEEFDYAVEPFEPRTPEDLVLLEYHRLQAALSTTRSHRRRHETPLEHAARTIRRAPDLARAFENLTRPFYRILYGRGKLLRGEELEEVRKSARTIRRRLT